MPMRRRPGRGGHSYSAPYIEKELTGPPSISRWLRETAGGLYAASILRSSCTPARTSDGGVGRQPHAAHARLQLLRLTHAALSTAVDECIIRLQTALQTALQPPTPLPTPADGTTTSINVAVSAPEQPVTAPGSDPMDVINSVSTAQPALSSATLLHHLTRAVHERGLRRGGGTAGTYAASSVDAPPLVPHALRLLECLRTLHICGAGAGEPTTAFASWALLLASSCEGPSCEATTTKPAPPVHLATLASALLLASTTLGLAPRQLPAVLAARDWPWLATGVEGKSTSMQASLAPDALMDDARAPDATTTPSASLTTSTSTSAPVATTARAPAVVGVTCLNTTDPAYASEVVQRTPQVALFTPEVRRDLYAIVLNPTAPGSSPPAATDGDNNRNSRNGDDGRGSGSVCGVALVGRESTAGHAVDTFAYVDRSAGAAAAAACGFTVYDDAILLESLQHIGLTTPHGLAVTHAFEAYLAKTVQASWGVETVKALSAGFLVAFAVEMTPRLDVYQRVRSTAMRPDEVATLAAPPYDRFVDQNLLRTFQRLP